MDCFINFIHYDIDVLSDDLCCISSDIQNGHNVHYNILLSWLCGSKLIYSLLNTVNIFGLKTVLTDMFYPHVYWIISSDIPNVLRRWVQWWAMNDALDMPSRQVGRVLIPHFL